MTLKNRTLEGKNRTLAGGGDKNRRKSSDIIYVRSLMVLLSMPLDKLPHLLQDCGILFA